jgi:hypothetical protein
MTRPLGDDSSNVVPLRRGHRRPAGASAPDLDSAMRAFDRLEQHADRLQAGPFAAAGESEWPIVSYQVQLPAVRRQLDKLGCFTIMNWPDTRWVLRLHAARTAAAECLDAVIRSLCRNPPGTGPLDDRLTRDVQRLTDALGTVRGLLAQQWPGRLRAP